MTLQETLKFLSPASIEIMYQDIDEQRLDVFAGSSGEITADQLAEYRELSAILDLLEEQYQNLTGEELWAVIASDRINKGDIVSKTIEWLNALEQIVGQDSFLDTMPNNFGGRLALQELVRGEL